ncbi:MAG: beta-propeller domain-containing protein [Isosphaeraceae bacterium]
MLKAFENGRLVATQRAERVREIHLVGRGRGNTLKIDQSHGLIRAASVLDGGVGSGNLLVGGSGLTVYRNGRASDSLTPFGSDRAFRRFLADRSASMRNRPWPNAPTAGGSTSLTKPTDSGYSHTNVQVPGVDEADLVESDGSSLFVISGSNLVVVNAQDPSNLSVASKTPIDGSPIAEYLDDGRLTVLSSLWTPLEGRLPAGKQGVGLPALWLRGQGQTEVTVFDVSDPSRPPSIVQQTKIDGNYDDSRMIGGKLYLITQADLLSGLWMTPMVLGVANAGDSKGAPDLSRTPLDRLLPGYTSVVYNTDGTSKAASGLLVQPSDILDPIGENDANLLAISVLDIRGSTPGPVGGSAMMGSYASTIHVDANSLSIFSPVWNTDTASTEIVQFSLSGTNPALLATGSVPGTIFDPYSADSEGGYLRVATSANFGTSSDNGVYVLQAHSGRLDIVGMVDGIAPGESILSARFQGGRAFLVTYEQTDPLWGIDLSDPRSPRVAGSLVVPGYSAFLQPIDSETILGIGREVDPASREVLGLKLSLFNVNDLSHPSLIATQEMTPPGASWAWSNAEWDPHALGFFPESGVVAIPLQGYGPADHADVSGDWRLQSDLAVYRIDPARGFRPLGVVEHDSTVERSIRIGDVLFSIADREVKAVRIGDVSLTSLGSVTIGTDDTHGGGLANGGAAQ